jgi:hypothetical protein
MNAVTIILIIIAIATIAFGLVMYYQREKTRRLRIRFGPEYDRMVEGRADRADQRRAEEELRERERRVETFHIRELTQAEVDRFSDLWRSAQARFVDAPGQTVAESDRLIRDVMAARGYPMGDFEQCAADISVDHPVTVDNYRAAHRIALRQNNEQVSTEDLRQAMVHYRGLFDELIGKHFFHHAETRL